jgi:alpha-galactosidase
MNKMMKLFLFVFAWILLFCKVVIRQESGLSQNVGQWLENNFAKGKISPFSFVYGGKSSEDFIKNCQYTAEKIKTSDPNIEEYIFSYADKRSGLMVKCFVSSVNDFPAVEWVFEFSNRSNQNTLVIENVAAVNQVFSYNEIL